MLDRPLCRGTAANQVNPCQSSAYATYFYDGYTNSSNPNETFPASCSAPTGSSDPVGRATVETFRNAAGSSWRCYGYDARGRTTSSGLSVSADGQTTTQTTLMSYNDAGAVTSLTYPDGEVLSSNEEDLRKIQKEKTMITENQDIILYAPKSNVFTAVILGVMTLSIGSVFLFSTSWQFPFLLGGLFFITVGIWFGLVIAWQMLHDPILTINTEGISSQAPFLKAYVRWEEIDSIYSLHARSRDAFALDASPAGLLSFFSRRGVRIPRQMDITVPQQALVISSTNLPLPVDQILTLIRERFSGQLEQYHIVLDDGHGENENF